MFQPWGISNIKKNLSQSHQTADPRDPCLTTVFFFRASERAMVFSKDFLTGATCGIAQACRDPLRSTEETSLHFQICHLRTFWGPYGRNDIFIRFQTSSCIYPISTCCAQRLRPSPNSLRSGHAKGRILRQIQRFTWSDAKFKKASIQARHGHLGQSWGTQQRMVAGCTDTVIQYIYTVIIYIC